MRIKLIGAFVVVAILAIAGVVAMRVGTTEAGVTSNTEQRGALYGDGVSAQQREAGGKPYIGIAMTSVPDDADGALIVRVVEGSAAEGNLQAGDIITALDGDAVEGLRDVVDIVRDHSPGDVIVFTVSRDGASTNISITVGEREAYGHDYDRWGKRPGYGFGFFGDASERLILSDTRYMTDDGVKRVRKAVGTAQNINAGAGAFDLLLRDGSETLSFTISDDTKIIADATRGRRGHRRPELRRYHDGRRDNEPRRYAPCGVHSAGRFLHDDARLLRAARFGRLLASPLLPKALVRRARLKRKTHAIFLSK